MKNDNPICLGAMPVGIICEIRNITSDKETERRLLELGVRIGSLVKVLNRHVITSYSIHYTKLYD